MSVEDSNASLVWTPNVAPATSLWNIEPSTLINIGCFLISAAMARYGSFLKFMKHSFSGLSLAAVAITQILQEGVVEQERNTVFGVHSSVCRFFGLLKDILLIGLCRALSNSCSALPNAKSFGLLCALSYLFVLGGLAFYVRFLIEVDSCITQTMMFSLIDVIFVKNKRRRQNRIMRAKKKKRS